MAPVKSTRRPRRRLMRRKGARKGRTTARDVPDIASCSVKRTINQVGALNFNTNVMYQFRNVSLSDYDRAVGIAKQYQHYRIKKVTLTLKPVYDTYAQGIGANISKPNLYYMIDKSGSLPDNIQLEQLKQMGAKAHAFDERPFTISWRPSVLTGDTTAPGVLTSAQYRISPWLSTSANPMVNPWAPSSVDHLGIFWFVEQLFAPEEGIVYNAEVEVQFQFKKPLMNPSAAGVVAKGVEVAQLDNSPDGIVGGPDSQPHLVP